MLPIPTATDEFVELSYAAVESIGFIQSVCFWYIDLVYNPYLAN